MRARARRGASAPQARGGREVQAQVERGLARGRLAFVDDAMGLGDTSARRTGRWVSARSPPWMPTSRPVYRIGGVTPGSDGAGRHDMGPTGLVGARPRTERALARQAPDATGTGLRPRLGRRRGLRRPVVPGASLVGCPLVELAGQMSGRGPVCSQGGTGMLRANCGCDQSVRHAADRNLVASRAATF
jgi:hypothetical protein